MPRVFGRLARSFFRSAERQIIAVNDFRFVDVAEEFFDIGAAAACNAACVAAAVVGEPVRDFQTFRREAGDGCAAQIRR